jgi:hypothetical protein
MDEKDTMAAQNGVNGTNGVNGKHSEIEKPPIAEKDEVEMPSGEIIPDPDAHLSEEERIAAVRKFLWPYDTQHNVKC